MALNTACADQAIESLDPSARSYLVKVRQRGLIAIAGWQVGNFYVRASLQGEVSMTDFGTRPRGAFVVEYVPDGSDLADDAGITTPGEIPDEAAEAYAWFVADELSRHLVVDGRGLGPCIRAFPGILHVLRQFVAIAAGVPPIPWHHSPEYRNHPPTLRPCDPTEVERALNPPQEGEAA